MIFWSWKEYLESHKIKIVQDNILNIIMLMPLGVALPIVMNKKAKMWQACLAGVCISSVIEISQLVFKVGCFEWDDIIHNTIGVLMGTIIMNRIGFMKKSWEIDSVTKE